MSQETYTLQELQSDPNVSFMDNQSIVKTIVDGRTAYNSYISVGVNASVYGQERYYE